MKKIFFSGGYDVISLQCQFRELCASCCWSACWPEMRMRLRQALSHFESTSERARLNLISTFSPNKEWVCLPGWSQFLGYFREKLRMGLKHASSHFWSTSRSAARRTQLSKLTLNWYYIIPTILFFSRCEFQFGYHVLSLVFIFWSCASVSL